MSIKMNACRFGKRFSCAPVALLMAATLSFNAQAANPEHLEHPHSAGTFMIEYQYMHMSMDGMRDGTKDVKPEEVVAMMGDYGYMMSPTSMSMDMHMLMPMYNISKELSVMGMINYVSNKMDMINMGLMASSMETSGLGDTSLNVNYKFMEDTLATSLTVSLPTGSISEKVTMMGSEQTAPYAMQLGSGTVDMTPALTYLGALYSTRYGGQLSYTWRMGENDSGYTLGNRASAKAWVAHNVSKLNLRLTADYNRWGDIEGKDTTIMTTASTGVPTNYGGSNINMGLKASTTLGMTTMGVSYAMPVYQDLNGVQMKGKSTIMANINAMF